MNLKETLDNYSKSNIYPFHMPGHKRQLDGCYKIDMTEVEGVDDLHDPEYVIAFEQERLAKLYGADRSYILVGGSTVGNLVGIYAACKEGDTVIIQRNSHKSVYNAVTLRHLNVEYIFPQIAANGIYSAVQLDEVKRAVEASNNPKAIVLTSPTYEGFHCDLKRIYEYCRQKNILLIVDQAHGAHLGFHDSFKNSAVTLADITIQSLHKTLPALTQTAVMHIHGDRVNANKIREALDIFETSSPSYVLMNSISECLSYMENCGKNWEDYVENLRDFYDYCGKLKHLQILSDREDKKDPGKLVISTEKTSITGVELAKILRNKYELETELSSFAYVLAMTSIMDKKEGFDRLKKALEEIDNNLEEGHIEVPAIGLKATKKMELYEAKAKDELEIRLEDAIGMPSASMVCLYPPGAPVIVPGEEITSEAIAVIKEAKQKGIHVTGISGDRISVVN